MKKYIAFICVGLGLAGCIQEPNFSNVPFISFKRLSKVVSTDAFTKAKKDSVTITIFFQDGDGDLGMTQKDFQDDKSPLKGINNYEIKQFRRKNGVFVEVPLQVSLSGFFPPLRTDGKTGPIEGDLDYSIDFVHAFVPKRDTLQFEIRIRDRKLNYSNSIKTDPIVVNE